MVQVLSGHLLDVLSRLYSSVMFTIHNVITLIIHILLIFIFRAILYTQHLLYICRVFPSVSRVYTDKAVLNPLRLT